MPTGPAGDNLHLLEIPKFLFSDVHLIEEHFSGFLRNSAEQRVAHGARLLKNFLLHEMLEAAFFGHDRVPGDVLDRAVDGVAFEIHQADALRGEHGDFAVAEEEHIASVLENRGNIACDKKLVLTQPYHNGRAKACRNYLERIARGQCHESVSPAHHFDCLQNSSFERSVFRIFFDEVRDDFSIRFGEKFVTFFDELMLQLHIIFDDAIVYDDDFTGAVAVRVGILFGWASVGGPTGVADSVDTIEGSNAD